MTQTTEVAHRVRQARAFLEAQLEARPLELVVTTAGVGFVIGGGLGRSFRRLLEGLVIRALVMPLVSAPLVDGLKQAFDATATTSEGAGPKPA